MDASSRDRMHMRRALDLAAQGLGRVEPNPMVGAVVVQGDQVVGEGHHQRFGGPHAEVAALQAAGPQARGAELFISLEPCCHHGKTPPCTDAILAAGVRRVVAAVVDPFPEVSGRGMALLKAAGIETAVGVLEAEARRLNAAFFKRQKMGLPLVIAKWAMTLDGRMTTAARESQWISSEESRRRVHEMRRVVDAVLVGAGTVLADEPSLTVRHVDPLPERGQPTRVVLDGRLMIDPARNPARTACEIPVIVYTSAEALRDGAERAAALRQAGCEIVVVPRDSEPSRAGQSCPPRPSLGAPAAPLSLRAVLEDLGARGMSRVLVESGARVLGSFFAARLADRLMIFVSPRVLASGDALGPAAGPDGRTLAEALPVADLTVERVGPDLLIQGRVGEF
ncbi:MAG: bifunctional diaminohydroxyphosphoribosylaminopyrimidine deaminase/5-amino-6-(5-phosphoribosylamino)uracil reductase RibD [Planctomycetota bacterium]|nr:bifunctional diaminohydroxyphosphoribosylaminopyrimidine deaminase/5-amino-6-(5-phosphoribosylamino)uracil reductase RibD [Planctomycetota bacterium]